MSRPAALVTGASRGIGFGIAMELAHKGFNIAINSERDDEQLDQAVAALQAAAPDAKVVKIVADVSDLSAHQSMLEQAEAVVGTLTTLVNNAGVSVMNRGDLLEVTEESYDRCMAINAKAHFFLSQAFARLLVSRNRDDGRYYSIVNITSSNASAVAVQRAEYCVSKAAAAMVSKSFAVRLGEENIAVFDVQPGLIETDMTRAVKDLYQSRIEQERLTLFPRLGQPQDMGQIVATLATGGLPYMTGQVLSADAGLLVSRY